MRFSAGCVRRGTVEQPAKQPSALVRGQVERAVEHDVTSSPLVSGSEVGLDRALARPRGCIDACGTLLPTFLDAVDDESRVGLQRTAQEPRDVGVEQHGMLVSVLDPSADPSGLARRGLQQQHVRLQRREHAIGEESGAGTAHGSHRCTAPRPDAGSTRPAVRKGLHRPFNLRYQLRRVRPAAAPRPVPPPALPKRDVPETGFVPSAAASRQRLGKVAIEDVGLQQHHGEQRHAEDHQYDLQSRVLDGCVPPGGRRATHHRVHGRRRWRLPGCVPIRGTFHAAARSGGGEARRWSAAGWRESPAPSPRRGWSG